MVREDRPGGRGADDRPEAVAADRAGAAEGASARGRSGPAEPAGPICELCGAPMLDRHCKVVCLNCGYQRDCSDP